VGGIERGVWFNQIHFTALRSFAGADPRANDHIVNATPFFAQEDSSKECTDAEKCAALLRFIRGVQSLPVGSLPQGQVVIDDETMPRAVRSALDREFPDFAALQRKFLPGDSSALRKKLRKYTTEIHLCEYPGLNTPGISVEDREIPQNVKWTEKYTI
jgi:hypothetical protein